MFMVVITLSVGEKKDLNKVICSEIKKSQKLIIFLHLPLIFFSSVNQNLIFYFIQVGANL